VRRRDLRATVPHRIILSSPGVGSFTRQIALALYENDMLARYATTLAYSKIESSIFPGIESISRRRLVTEIPVSKLVKYPWRELLRMAFARVDRSGVLADAAWDWADKGFDEWVGTTQLDAVDAVYGYEHASLRTFLRARAEGIINLYDVPAPDHEFVNELLANEVERYPSLGGAYFRRTQKLRGERSARRRKEWDLADAVFANSEFTKSSYLSAGLDTDKVHVVKLGAPAPAVGAKNSLERKDTHLPLRVLYAGTFSIRKGAHYLLEAWRLLGAGHNAKLDVVGHMEMPSEYLSGLKGTIDFHGSVPYDVLLDYYDNADVLVFPTLCDGFGLVVTEAMSRGLPVITTERAGASQLVEHEVNGLLADPGNARAIRDALQWCLDHRDTLKKMGLSALKTATSWQWSDYRKAFASKILEVLQR